MHLFLQLLHALLQLLALPLGLGLQVYYGLSLLAAQGSLGLLQCCAQLLSVPGVLFQLAGHLNPVVLVSLLGSL